MEAELVGFSFAISPGRAAYLPVAHDYPAAPDQVSLEQALQALKPVLENPAIAKVGQNLKYDMSVLARYGIAIEGPIHDTMLQSYVLNSVATRHNMDALAGYYLNKKTIHFEDIAGKGAKQLTFNQVPLETAADYAAEDADITFSCITVCSRNYRHSRGCSRFITTLICRWSACCRKSSVRVHWLTGEC